MTENSLVVRILTAHRTWFEKTGTDQQLRWYQEHRIHWCLTAACRSSFSTTACGYLWQFHRAASKSSSILLMTYITLHSRYNHFSGGTRRGHNSMTEWSLGTLSIP